MPKENVENKNTVPIWHKINLTVTEAANYSNIGLHKIRELMKQPNCSFVLNVGDTKQLIKRELFEDFLKKANTI